MKKTLSVLAFSLAALMLLSACNLTHNNPTATTEESTPNATTPENVTPEETTPDNTVNNTPTEKTYTVPTLGTYVTDYTVLSDEVKQQLIDKATEKIREHYLATYPSGVMYTDKSVLSTTYYLEDYQAVENISLVAVYTGVYSGWFSDDRETGFIFSADFSGHDTEAANTTGYFYAYFENLIVNEDGSLQTGWEESVYLKGNAYVSEQLLKDKCLSGHDELVFTQQ